LIDVPERIAVVRIYEEFYRRYRAHFAYPVLCRRNLRVPSTAGQLIATHTPVASGCTKVSFRATTLSRR
jgi:hypothetical protein